MQMFDYKSETEQGSSEAKQTRAHIKLRRFGIWNHSSHNSPGEIYLPFRISPRRLHTAIRTSVMNILIVLSAFVALVSAEYYAQEQQNGYETHGYGGNYQQYQPIGPHGVPYDTDEVAAAKAVHYAAHATAHARYAAHAHGANAHGEDGPIDTPEVQIAKFQHLAAYATAKQLNEQPHLAQAAVPLDTPEVQLAKQEHFAAYAEAKFRSENPAAAHVPHAGPVDTVEVQQAKLQHFHAHAQAQAQALVHPDNGQYDDGNYVDEGHQHSW